MANIDKGLFTYPNDTPVVYLECEKAFLALESSEKRYAHHLSKASYYGGLIVLAQTSPESPLIFNLIHQIFSKKTVEEVRDIALNKAGFIEEEFQAFMVYVCGFYTNMGNYKGFGDSKFIPNLPQEKLEALVNALTSSITESNNILELWSLVKDSMFSLDQRKQFLGLGEMGVTTYFSSNCTLKDAEFVNRFFKVRGIEGYNNRCFKHMKNGATTYEIRVASIAPRDNSEPDVFEGASFTMTGGDYSSLLELVNAELEQAKTSASNETEVHMVEKYIESFATGSLDAHKDGSRFWIKNKGPIIETYIGFIETYRDPSGVRGEFEGFVAVVNKPMSAKFSVLVEKAETLLKLLPWDQVLEKDTFLRPDFTSLDVVSFAGSGIPAGINIPNYDEIRQNEGFKNVSLGNVIPASYKDAKMPFVSSEDKALMDKYRVESFEVQVGLHELLGHGSGKLLRREKGELNFDEAAVKNILQAGEELKYYEEGETYDSVFTTIGSAYEECRAECVGLYLSLDKDVLRIFGHEGDEAEDVIYTNWLSMVFAGVAKALEMYAPATNAWLQAHSQARYAILQVMLEADGLLRIEERTGEDGNPDLLIKLERSKISTEGKRVIGDFLRKLQVFKATANVKGAKALFDKYTEVKEPWSKWRDIVLARRTPRKLFVQANTEISGEDIILRNYEASPSGLIKSWTDRFAGKEASLYKALTDIYNKDKDQFKF
ncbi:dipeptidyl peptidase 3-like isoform X2 [Artemia franciscana]